VNFTSGHKTLLCPGAQDLNLLHRAMLIYWNHVSTPSITWCFRHAACSSVCQTPLQSYARRWSCKLLVALQWVNKAPKNNHGSDAFRSMLTKPRKTKDFHAAVQQASSPGHPRLHASDMFRLLRTGAAADAAAKSSKIAMCAMRLVRLIESHLGWLQGVNRLLQQASKVRPSPAALAAAAAAAAQQQQKKPSPAKRAQQAQAAMQPVAPPPVAPAAARAGSAAAPQLATAGSCSNCKGHGQPAAAAAADRSQGIAVASPPAQAAGSPPCASPTAAAGVAARSPNAAHRGSARTAAAAPPPESADQAKHLPRLLTVQMLPWGGAAKARVTGAGANPYLELANLK